MTAATGLLSDYRWQDYVMVRGSAFHMFWSEHGGEPGRRVLFIVGRGFDPRAPIGLQRLATAANGCPIDVVALHFGDELAADSQQQREAAEANWKVFGEIIAGRGKIESKTVAFRNEKRDSVADRSAANLFADADVIDAYTDVVIDISAMPRVVYFPLISRLIYFHD